MKSLSLFLIGLIGLCAGCSSAWYSDGAYNENWDTALTGHRYVVVCSSFAVCHNRAYFDCSTVNNFTSNSQELMWVCNENNVCALVFECVPAK